MAIQIQLRRDLSSNWASNNPILAQGEPGLEIDTNLIKLGDGTTNWNSLPYFSNLTGLVSLTANWEDTYSIMQANSANWSYVAANSGYTDNSFGNSAYTTVNTNSAGWESTETTVNANSAGWESAETTVATNSADWSYVAANSAHTDNSFGNSAYTTVNTNSAGWESAETTVATNSADWSYVAANSGYSYNDFYVTGDIYATGSLSADSIKFNTEAGITPGVGELTWNADEESLDYGVNSDVTLQIGQEQLIHVKAEEDIKNGQAVYASGASGAGSGNITVRLYRAAAGDIDELYFIGVATQDISTNNFGFVTTFGKVRGVEVADTRASDDPQALSANNEGWDIGTVLYVSPAEAGKFTQTKPTAPDRDIPVVMIISENGNQRTFFTRYEHGYHLDEIHDVLYNEPLEDGDLLTWNDTLSTWQNSPETDPVFSTWAQANSASYSSTYTTVNTNSANWDQTLIFNDATAELTISNGNTVSLSALSGGGGTLTNETDPIFSTWAQANSANYESAFTTVNANSSSWAAGGSGSGSLSGISYNRWGFTGNGTLSTFSITGANSEPSEAYTVTIDATLQDPNVYTIDKDGDTITFDSPPPLSSYIVVVEQYAYAAAAGSTPAGVTTGKAIAMAIVFG